MLLLARLEICHHALTVVAAASDAFLLLIVDFYAKDAKMLISNKLYYTHLTCKKMPLKRKKKTCYSALLFQGKQKKTNTIPNVKYN